MSKKPKSGGAAGSGENLEEHRDVHDDVGHVNRDPNHEEKLFKVATSEPRTIINGHVLTVGTVVEMTADEIAKHRDQGVPLHDVKDDDNREVYSVREPYVAKEE